MNTTVALDFNQAAFMKKLPALLRILGAGALVVAMYGFLARGWQGGNDLSRYLMMLSHTGLLCVVGLASGHWLKEGKGARLLLTLALASVPANFAILGAFIFSQIAPVDVAHYPQYVAWSVGSSTAALLTTGAALLVLVPVVLLGFTVLARSLSRRLALLFLASNLALLLPLRDAHEIGLLVATLTGAVVWFSRRAADHRTVARTAEGMTALGLQLLPLGVLLGRSLWLYAFDLFLTTLLAGTLFVLLRQSSLYLTPGSRLRNGLDALSLAPALAIAPLLSAAVDATGLLLDAWVLPTGALAAALLVYDISRRNAGQGHLYRRLAVAVLLIGMGANLILFADLPAAVACLLAGTAVAVWGYCEQQLSVFVGGLLLALAGVVQQFVHLLGHFDLASWASLAVVGTVSIVFASLLEARGGILRARLQAWRSRLQTWEA